MSDGVIGASGAFKIHWPYLNQRYLDIVTSPNEGNAGLSRHLPGQSIEYKRIQPDFEHVLQAVMGEDVPESPSVNIPPSIPESGMNELSTFMNTLPPLDKSHYRAVMARNAYQAMSHAS